MQLNANIDARQNSFSEVERLMMSVKGVYIGMLLYSFAEKSNGVVANKSNPTLMDYSNVDEMLYDVQSASQIFKSYFIDEAINTVLENRGVNIVMQVDNSSKS